MATSGSTEDDNYYDYDYDYYNGWTNPKKSLPAGVHKLNKNEAKLLRKLKAETGLTEEEIRKEKKYRIMLSTAQDKGEKPNKNTKTRKEKAQARIMKQVTRKLKLAKEHPLVVEEFNKLWKEHTKYKYYY